MCALNKLRLLGNNDVASYFMLVYFGLCIERMPQRNTIAVPVVFCFCLTVSDTICLDNVAIKLQQCPDKCNFLEEMVNVVEFTKSLVKLSLVFLSHF